MKLSRGFLRSLQFGYLSFFGNFCCTVGLCATLFNQQPIDLFQAKRLGTWACCCSWAWLTEQRLFTKTYASKNLVWRTAPHHVPEMLKVIRCTVAVLLTAGAQMTSFWDLHETDLSHCPSYFTPNADRSGKILSSFYRALPLPPLLFLDGTGLTWCHRGVCLMHTACNRVRESVRGLLWH